MDENLEKKFNKKNTTKNSTNVNRIIANVNTASGKNSVIGNFAKKKLNLNFILQTLKINFGLKRFK
jgi:hypothetical protein